MQRKELQTAAGNRFGEILKRKGLGPSAFALKVGKAAGTDIGPQHVNNWRRRGVPAALSNLVAELLECRPETISAALPARGAPKQEAQPATTTPISGGQQLILAMCADFTPQQMADLAQAAARIRDGTLGTAVPRTKTPGEPPAKKKK